MTSVVTPICSGCKHRIGTLLDPKCDAYPDGGYEPAGASSIKGWSPERIFVGGIPWPILLSEADHRKPYAGDNGITFEPKTPKDAKYAETIFDRG